LLAPLFYDRPKRGYCYSDTSFELPAAWITEDKLLSLALALRLASTIPDRTMKADLYRLLDQVYGPHDIKEKKNCLNQFNEKISVKNIEYAQSNEQFFHLTVESLLNERPLRISYHSPYSGKTTERSIQPLHLMQYMGNWHLLAWCAMKHALRNFALARLVAVQPTDEEIVVPSKLPPIKEYTRRHFGLIQGTATQEVTLRFSARVAPRIKEQIWHPAQQMTMTANGELLLSFPAGDFRELVKVILGHGAEVKVVEPEELKQRVRTEIEKMNEIYVSPDTV